MPSTRDLLAPTTKAMSRRVGSFVGSLDMLGPTLEYEPPSPHGSDTATGITDFRSPHRIILEGSGELPAELDESWAL